MIDSTSTWIVYCIPLIFCILRVSCPVGSVRTEQTLDICSLISMVLILIMRYNVGYDYNNYMYLHSTHQLPSEPVSLLIGELSYYMGDPVWYINGYAFFTMLFVALSFIRNSSITSAISYLCLPFFFIDDFSIIRGALAIAVCCYGYALFTTEKQKAGIFVCVMSLAVHVSSLPFVATVIILYLFRGSSALKLGTASLIITALVVLSSELLTYLVPKYTFYAGQTGNDYGRSLVVLIILLFIVYGTQNGKNNFVLMMTACIFALWAISVNPVFLRVSTFFLIPLLFIDLSNVRLGIIFPRVVPIACLVTIYFMSLFIKSSQTFGPFIPYNTWMAL